MIQKENTRTCSAPSNISKTFCFPPVNCRSDDTGFKWMPGSPVACLLEIIPLTPKNLSPGGPQLNAEGRGLWISTCSLCVFKRFSSVSCNFSQKSLWLEYAVCVYDFPQVIFLCGRLVSCFPLCLSCCFNGRELEPGQQPSRARNWTRALNQAEQLGAPCLTTGLI